jgi:type I restriction enzyme S subunit
MEQKKSLPVDWIWTTLGEQAVAQSGAGFPKSFQGLTAGDYPLAKVSDISDAVKFNNAVLGKANNYLSTAIAQKIGAKPFPEGTTLFAKIGEALRLNRRAISTIPILADNNVMGLIPITNRVIPKFLFYFMNTIDLSEYSQATTVPSVRKSDIENIPFPLPPKPVQEQIIARIEELFTQLDAGTAALKRVQAGLKRYKASVLKASVEGRLVPQDPSDEPAEEMLRRRGKKPLEGEDLPSLPSGWCWTKLGEIATHRLGKMLDKGKNKGELKPYLRNTNVRWFEFDLADIKYIRTTEDELVNISVEVDDLVICEGGEPGRAAVWNGGRSMVIQKALHRVRTIPGISPKYLSIQLAADANAGALEKYFTGSTIKHFTGESLHSYVFPLPPQHEQIQIIAEVERQLSLISDIEISVEKMVDRAIWLRQSILKQAFEGNLV